MMVFETAKTARRIKRGLTGLSGFALAIAGASVAPAATGKTAADLILTNARVYTVEKAHPWGQAVAIKDGKILAVGSAAVVARNKGAATKVVDLGGKMVLPSFGDAHNHPLFGGLSQARCPIHSGKTVEDYKRLVSACADKAPGNSLIYGLGWTETTFPNGSPRKETLDEISRDRPIAIGSGDGHSMWVNSKMLEIAGITRDTPDPAGGKIIRDPRTGEPTGHISEESAMALIEKFVPPPTDAEIQNAIIWVLKHFNGIGITNWHDAGVDIDDDGKSAVIEAYRAVKDKGLLTSHVVIAQKWKNDRGLEQIPSILRGAERAKSYGLNAYSVKYYLDGVIPQHTAAMLEPYEGTSDRGKATIPPAMLNDAITALDAKGVQAHIHAIGDGAVREGLDAFAAARQRNGKSDTRPMMSHMNVIDPADQPRFGQLGAYAVFQPLWASNEAYMDLSKTAIGPKRSGYIYPAGGVVKGGGKLAYGADWPVASANPLEGIEVALTRINHARPELGPLLPGEAVTLPEAIASYTIHVAEVNHNDEQTGSIAPGKSADLIVIDRNLFDIPANQISQAKVLLTLFAGKPVFGDLGAVGTSK